MTCPTCSGTMGKLPECQHEWCRRCGTIAIFTDVTPAVIDVPAAITRLKEFLSNCDKWAERLKIKECYTPNPEVKL